jgi:hypothetical protein
MTNVHFPPTITHTLPCGGEVNLTGGGAGGITVTDPGGGGGGFPPLDPGGGVCSCGG